RGRPVTDAGVQAPTGGDQQREARASLLVADADVALVVEWHGSLSLHSVVFHGCSCSDEPHEPRESAERHACVAPLPRDGVGEGHAVDGLPFPRPCVGGGSQFNGPPFPASATAEGAQLNVPPSSAGTLVRVLEPRVKDGVNPVCMRSGFMSWSTGHGLVTMLA